MVLPASTAISLTDTALTTTNTNLVNTDISLAEGQIRAAAGRGLTVIKFNALNVGNPIGDPQVNSNLANDNQVTFRDAFNSAGYIVGWDPTTSYWILDWTTQGIETLVKVYSFRTTLAPGSIHAQTITAINNLFAGEIPVSHSKTVLVPTVNEPDFGGTLSVFYEYLIIVNQPVSTDYSAAVKTAVIGQGLGYNSGNCACYKFI